jgi:hypothetical protein
MFNYAIWGDNVANKFEMIVCIKFALENADNKQSYVSAFSEIKKLYREIKDLYGDYDWETFEVCF